MFFIRELSGVLGPYQPGLVRRRRAVDPVGAISTSNNTELRESSTIPTSARPASEPALAAYDRALNPETPRQRVLFVNQLMSRSVVTIAGDATLLEASKIFATRRFRHIPVVDAAGALLGILSDRDLLRYAVNDGWRDQPVSTIMTSPVLLASSDTEMREVARIMFEERVGCMPIIDADNSLIGIITRSDVLRTLLVRAPLELWH